MGLQGGGCVSSRCCEAAEWLVVADRLQPRACLERDRPQLDPAPRCGGTTAYAARNRADQLRLVEQGGAHLGEGLVERELGHPPMVGAAAVPLRRASR